MIRKNRMNFSTVLPRSSCLVLNARNVVFSFPLAGFMMEIFGIKISILKPVNFGHWAHQSSSCLRSSSKSASSCLIFDIQSFEGMSIFKDSKVCCRFLILDGISPYLSLLHLWSWSRVYCSLVVLKPIKLCQEFWTIFGTLFVLSPKLFKSQNFLLVSVAKTFTGCRTQA